MKTTLARAVSERSRLAIAAALALEPAAGRWRPARIDVSTADPLARGQTIAEFRPERWFGGVYGSGPRNVDVLVDVPAARGAGGVHELISQWKARHIRWARG